MSTQEPRNICVVLVDRANYGRLKPVMKAIDDNPALRLQIIVTGTMVLERFDYPVRVLNEDGFEVDAEIFMELEGSNPTTMAKSLGFGVVEFASVFQRLRPDIVVIIGDRYEALAAALCAAYMNFCIFHLQGGEVSGSIDESARHAITKLAHFHVPSTRRSAEYLIRMGERPDTIVHVGCPSSDIARMLDRTLGPETVNSSGSGAIIDVTRPYLLVVFHPTTTEYGGERTQMRALLDALDEIAMPTLMLWPNIDAGADHISKEIRIFRADRKPAWLRTLTNVSPEDYLRVLSHAACAVGNSSSFVRDAGYFGTPVVLIGNRQEGREADVHATRVQPLADSIVSAIRNQIAHGAYAPSALYGDGYVSQSIANALAMVEPYIQKRLDYVYQTGSARPVVPANGHGAVLAATASDNG